MNYDISSLTENTCIISFTPANNDEKTLLIEMDDNSLHFYLQQALEIKVNKEAVLLEILSESKNPCKVKYQLAKGLGS